MNTNDQSGSWRAAARNVALSLASVRDPKYPAIGPGTAGVVNIEREAALSGAIHTKGFYILGGLLRHLLRTSHPLAFNASVALEQSYGGIDGDSASSTELYALLSALSNIPIHQGQSADADSGQNLGNRSA